jgi:hypothetical protein
VPIPAAAAKASSLFRPFDEHALPFFLPLGRVGGATCAPQAHSAFSLFDRHVALRARQLRPFFAAPSPSAGVAAAAGGGANGGRASGDAAAGIAAAACIAAAAEAEAHFAARTQRRFMRQALPASVSREVRPKGFPEGLSRLHFL